MEDALSKVESYIESYGWTYQRLEDKMLLSQFYGENADTYFNLIFTAKEYWIELTVCPYFLLPTDKEKSVYEALCRLNFQIRFARLSISERCGVALCVDIPMEKLDEDILHLSIDVITYYADQLYPQLLEFWA